MAEAQPARGADDKATRFSSENMFDIASSNKKAGERPALPNTC